MYETSKAMIRRNFDARFATRWFVGSGVDIGAGKDTLGNFRPFLPRVTSVRAWDVEDGDAMLMEGVADDSFDFVHSSHCLEHLVDPGRGLENWIRICKPGGHVVVLVPDEDLYEQGMFPSQFNRDHKWTFTVTKAQTWSPRCVRLFDLIGRFSDRVSVQKIEVLDAGYFYDTRRMDQTMLMTGEAAIEFVLRKRTAEEIARGGRFNG